MTPAQLQNRLNELLSLPSETEWVEFKEAKSNFHFGGLGKYFSALSNEANLKRLECGWLVLGVSDKLPRQVVGTAYRPNRPALDSLKQEVATHTTDRITFDEIHELVTPEGRVLMFQIPPALRGMPTAWKGLYYGRDGESLGPLSLTEIERIRRQGVREDWSARICEAASLDDLDPDAIRFAREQYREKFAHLDQEVGRWDDLTFLNKAKVCTGNQITHAALMLLGRDESTHFLSPAQAWITWALKGANGLDRDYAHLGPPFILAVDQVLGKIRNLTVRYLPSGTLFPKEASQYDSWVMREILHNCIAHQDYAKCGRINVVEEPESLLFTNLGEFLPGSVEDVIRHDAPPEEQRNPFLARAMFNLNMIDTIGGGIRRMFMEQRQRFFPLPDYDLASAGRVKVRLFGSVLDENYTRLLMAKADLDLWDVIALDKVQKERPLRDDEFKSVKAKKLIEGRRPNIFVSAKIAAITGDRAAYIKHRAFDKEHYKKMVVAYLKKFGEASREDIDKLLTDKISDALSPEQKANRVKNLLQAMRKEGVITAIRSGQTGTWVLSSRLGGEVQA